MKRHFYLVMRVLREKLEWIDAKEIVEKIFPDSDVKQHLIYKLSGYIRSRDSVSNGLFDFYDMLDSENQLIFDVYFNKEIAALESKIIPHSMF